MKILKEGSPEIIQILKCSCGTEFGVEKSDIKTKRIKDYVPVVNQVKSHYDEELHCTIWDNTPLLSYVYKRVKVKYVNCPICRREHRL